MSLFSIHCITDYITFIALQTCCLFRCGPLIDLCRGPHVRHTGKIKAMQVTKVNGLRGY